MNAEQLINFIQCGFNGLMIGDHGTGKTTLIKEVFTEMFGEQGVDWLYFSASTIDPWVDFIGIPKETVDENGIKYLDFVRPKAFATDTVKAIFLDEYNRSHPKVRNATMELIQFKSINGRRFPNLKVVWAAANPHEEDQDDQEATYSVDQLDPAQKDRFEVHIDMPYDVCDNYFVNKYGDVKGSGACHWWRNLPSKVKKKVSPRRLEYAMEAIENSAPIRGFIIPADANPAALIKLVSQGSPGTKLEEMLKNGADKKEFKSFFSDMNNFDAVKGLIKSNDVLAEKVLPFVGQEHLMMLIDNSRKIEDLVFKKKPLAFKKVLEDIEKYSKNAGLKNKANYALSKLQKKADAGPTDLSKLISKVAVTKNIEKANCSAHELEINRLTIINSCSIRTSKGMDKVLVSAIYSAQKKIKTAQSSFSKASELSLVASAAKEIVEEDVALGLLSLANVFCSRSQIPSVVGSKSLIDITRIAFASLAYNTWSSNIILDRCCNDFKYLYVRLLGSVSDYLINNPDMNTELDYIKEKLCLSVK